MSAASSRPGWKVGGWKIEDEEGTMKELTMNDRKYEGQKMRVIEEIMKVNMNIG